MSEETLHLIPPDIIKFLLVILFSLLIGLEQRRHHIKEEFESLFGTDRTFTLIGILGYILYIISPQTLIPFLGGGECNCSFTCHILFAENKSAENVWLYLSCNCHYYLLPRSISLYTS